MAQYENPGMREGRPTPKTKLAPMRVVYRPASPDRDLTAFLVSSANAHWAAFLSPLAMALSLSQVETYACTLPAGVDSSAKRDGADLLKEGLLQVESCRNLVVGFLGVGGRLVVRALKSVAPVNVVFLGFPVSSGPAGVRGARALADLTGEKLFLEGEHTSDGRRLVLEVVKKALGAAVLYLPDLGPGLISKRRSVEESAVRVAEIVKWWGVGKAMGY